MGASNEADRSRAQGVRPPCRGGGATDRRRSRHSRVPETRAVGHGIARAGTRRGQRMKLTVNGDEREVEAEDHESLLTVLRERLGLPGSKNACEQGECGSCSVLLDGALVCSCLVLAGAVAGRDVRTVEALSDDEGLHPVQRAFAETGAVQCGFCTPGLVVATYAL